MRLNKLTAKKKCLDGFRPLPDTLVRNLDDWFRVELTYTSNAIEGNTLTRRETALVVEKGLTVGGYPPAIIRKRDCLAYIGSLEKAQLGGLKDDYFNIIAKAVDRSLDIYVKAADGEDGEEAEPADSDQLLKIGELAKQVGQSNSTIRHWTKEGLLQVAEVTESGYQRYAPEMIERIKQIHVLKEPRFTLQEIKEKLS